ncbi:MAG: hypothetical protein QF463_14040 [Vicinamibacterales bacterium]|jgi:hypothetical protein|nr:hypothetical protein [Vicinamibacterales bacterium]MDP6610184.1 hypothetical protein [Vicinamibacterales bacterium]
MIPLARRAVAVWVCLMVGWAGVVPMSAQRAASPNAGAAVSRGLGSVERVRRLAFAVDRSVGVERIEVVAARAARQQAQEAPPAPAEPPSGGGNGGAVAALVIGAVLFGWLIMRGPPTGIDAEPLPGEREPGARVESEEIVDYAIFAGAVTLIGTGAVMLLAGS